MASMDRESHPAWKMTHTGAGERAVQQDREVVHFKWGRAPSSRAEGRGESHPGWAEESHTQHGRIVVHPGGVEKSDIQQVKGTLHPPGWGCILYSRVE